MAPRQETGLEEDFDNSGEGQLKAPGINYSVNFELPYNKRFRHGANDWQQRPRLTARELAMLGVMNALTDKPNWHEKVFDEEVTKKWELEARSMPLISEKAWEWCLVELQDKARRFEKVGRVMVLDGNSRVSKSDTSISQDLNQELRKAVQPLLERPDEGKDWHPGSDGQVLDLVHPSLFPLVFGRTRVLTDGGCVPLDFSGSNCFENTTVPPQRSEERKSMGFGSAWAWRFSSSHPDDKASSRFQWLPCEVDFTEDTGLEVRVTSYINNLHPKNKAFYAIIEKIISLAIPAWNDVLVHGFNGRTPPRIRTYGAQYTPELPDWYDGIETAVDNKTSDPEAYREMLRKVAEYCKLGKYDLDKDPEDDDDMSDSESESEIGPRYVYENGPSMAVDEYYHRHIRQTVHPEPGMSFTYAQWKAGLTGRGVVPKYHPIHMRFDDDPDNTMDDFNYYSLRIQDDFREEGLQVIVKLASIELMPEKPSYEGGSWHVEGLLNEHIAATALYYYDVENVTEARISFRTEADLDDMGMRYEQDDHTPLAEIFGIESGSLRDEAAIQHLGSVSTPQGRLLAFPNTLQHKVEPFELVDKTRPGHRRFLALWLVDPHYRICSTRNVPPQQQDWWAGGVGGENAPEEGWLMSLEEAKTLRLELMAERTKAVKAVETGTSTYNFCEH